MLGAIIIIIILLCIGPFLIVIIEDMFKQSNREASFQNLIKIRKELDEINKNAREKECQASHEKYQKEIPLAQHWEKHFKNFIDNTTDETEFLNNLEYGYEGELSPRKDVYPQFYEIHVSHTNQIIKSLFEYRETVLKRKFNETNCKENFAFSFELDAFLGLTEKKIIQQCRRPNCHRCKLGWICPKFHS